MADNTVLNLGSGGDTIATDDISGVKHQRVKIEYGTDGNATDVSATNPLPIDTAQTQTVTTVLNAVTSVSTGSATAVKRGMRAWQITETGTGAITGTVKIYGNNSNSNSGGVLLATVVLSGTTSTTDGFMSNTNYPYVYGDITAISGTSAAITVTVAT